MCGSHQQRFLQRRFPIYRDLGKLRRTPGNIVVNRFVQAQTLHHLQSALTAGKSVHKGAARVWLCINNSWGVQQATSLAQIISPQPVCPLSTPPLTSANATPRLQNAGAFPRDRFDHRRFIGEVHTRTGRFQFVGEPDDHSCRRCLSRPRRAYGLSDAWEAEMAAMLASLIAGR